MRWKAVLLFLIIAISLIPAALLYNYLKKAMRPSVSAGRFLLWMLAVFVFIFCYTFLLVFMIRLVFPGA